MTADRAQYWLEVVNRHYNLGARTIAPVYGGTINENYRLQNDHDSWFLRVYAPRPLSEIEFEHSLLDALATSDLLTPQPLSSIAGSTCISANEDSACVFPWIGSDAVPHGELACAAIGQLLAVLHTATESFAQGPIDPYGPANLAQRLDEVRAALGAHPELESVVETLEQERADWSAEQNDCVIHGDLFPDNVLWSQTTPIALDFEQARTGQGSYDVAVAINAWCFPAAASSVSVDQARALLVSYEHARGPIDRGQLLRHLRRASARFVISRLLDVYLQGDSRADKDFREYLQKLVSWRKSAPDWDRM